MVRSQDQPSNRTAALGFRFAVIVIALTGIAVAHVELERQRLLVERERVALEQRIAEATDRVNRAEVELAQRTAPGALLVE